LRWRTCFAATYLNFALAGCAAGHRYSSVTQPWEASLTFLMYL
jgi:hypothetical protein